jgi:hypothetical protein
MIPLLPPNVLIVLILSVSVVLADDFKTIYGKDYKNATLSRVEPDGILLRTKSGITKIYFTELPKEVQDRFNYNAQQAAQFTSQTTAQTAEENRLIQHQQAEEAQKKAAQLEMQRQREQAEMRRQQQQADLQRQQQEATQRQQGSQAQERRQVQTGTQLNYSRSQEGIPEHTYELTQDHTINFGGVSIRLRRGERYHGRILVDHAEIDSGGRSYTVPSGILRQRD